MAENPTKLRLEGAEADMCLEISASEVLCKAGC
jgi:hypothetical protein